MTRSGATFPAIVKVFPLLASIAAPLIAAPRPSYFPAVAARSDRLCFHSLLELPTKERLDVQALNERASPYLAALHEPQLFRTSLALADRALVRSGSFS
ncbi:hypothetical protein [Sphingomonas sp.]|uniref:hypothetical protein n=1 Tax=Sphingomonas sp. TaxID=28214 RepID=UPI003B3BE319